MSYRTYLGLTYVIQAESGTYICHTGRIWDLAYICHTGSISGTYICHTGRICDLHVSYRPYLGLKNVIQAVSGTYISSSHIKTTVVWNLHVHYANVRSAKLFEIKKIHWPCREPYTV